ncbi:DMT family transporter [Mesorhizobium sp. KR9-304]|uniref:DMT family transporter n=1 Tax=Mesorhizobium sp. KR9-304 TaxID=3156614 RepID=UPI0032B31AF4
MHKTAYPLLLLTTLFWGGNAVAGKLAVGHISPMLLTTARWGFALVLLCLIGWSRLASDWPTVQRNALYLIVLGAFGFTAFNVALYSAVVYTSAINVSIEQAAIPMLIFLANFLLFRLRATWAQIVGFVVSIAGVALTACHGDPARLLALDLNFGDVLMLVAVAAYAGYTVALRFKPDIHWQTLMIAMTAGAFITSLPFAVAELATGAAIPPDARGWSVVVYTTIFPSILAQLFFVKGVELIGANRAGLFVNLVPVFGTLMSVLLLGEDFYLYHAVALMLVLGGIWLAETSGRRAAADSAR